jgi:hypothetical protein
MKFKNPFGILEWLAALCMIAVLLALLFAPRAHATLATLTYPEGAPNSAPLDTYAFPLTLTNGQAVTFPANGTNSLDQTIRQDHGLSVFVQVVSTNINSAPTVLGFDVTPDGVSYTANHPLQATVPGGFVGTNIYWLTNWTSLQVNNFRQIQLTFATNNLVGGGVSNAVVVQKFWYSYSANQP